MLSARAYSFRQKSRLAISLSWIAGFCNVIAFSACGVFAANVTGTVTMIGREAGALHLRSILFLAFVWFAFLCGAVSSAIMTETARRAGSASKYIVPMLVQTMLLMLFAISLHYPRNTLPWTYWTTGLIAMAMGLQNATITKISGAVVRTTHLTGVTTDLGLEGIQLLYWLRDRVRHRRWERAGRILKVSQRHPSVLRVLLLASIIGSFLFGAVAGAFCYSAWKEFAVLAPILFLGWIVFVDWRTPIADVSEMDLMADPELRLLGILKPLLPPELGIWRVSCRRQGAWHQAPDFQTWITRLPEHWRVVILALSPLTRFDANSVMDLKGAIEQLHRQKRWLILSGTTPLQYRVIMRYDIDRSMNVENICPDLEYAIARGIDILETRQRPFRSDRRLTQA